MARIALDMADVVGDIDRRIFGSFIEHEGRAIYGGIYQPGSPLSDGEGLRQDTRQAIKELAVPVLRWPGGNFVSAYHWQDGVGPVEQRPARFDPAWGAVESNHFGTDEFMRYVEGLGIEPYLCLNMGTGTLDEAMAWLEYCNGTHDSYWVDLRRRHGREEPYGVRYWGLGNEMWGDFQIGHLTAEEYASKAKRWALALKRVDPSIQLVACGQSGYGDWDRVVIDELVRYVDWYSIHVYTGSDDYWTNVLTPHQADRALRTVRALIDRARYVQGVERPVHVTYDEWNVWFATREDRRRDKVVAERHTLADALAVATYLNIFVRHCDTVRMANMAQLVNVLAPIVTSDDGVLRQAIYHPLQLAARHTQEVALRAFVDCDTVEHEDRHFDRKNHRVADLGPFPVLDVAASRDRAGKRVVVSIVNRATDGPVRTAVDLGHSRTTGPVRVRSVTGPSPDAVNSWDDQQVVAAREYELSVSGTRYELDLPACSVTQLDFEVE